MKVRKRSGKIVDFNIDKIVNAIEMAMNETKEGINQEISHSIAKQIENEFQTGNTIEWIQDRVEEYLMEEAPTSGKQYIL